MRVRRARREDLGSLGRIAEAGLTTSYCELLAPATVDEMLAVEFSPSALRRRMLSGNLLVAIGADEQPVGFADAERENGHVVVSTIVTDPPYRRLGIGASLLAAAAELSPGDPVCAEVLLGNESGERFCEACGLVPGETVTAVIGDEQAVSRRWWLADMG
jgi:ribosomal protein S18 acetylase RimI-like enzyme